MAKYLIWSEEHGAWWAPGNWGYCASIVRAARFDKERAAEIVAKANIALTPPAFNEVALPDPLDAGGR